MTPLRLNICSGTDIREGNGWKNLDVCAWPLARRPPDVYWDGTRDDLPFPDGSACEVYCGYTFLHIPVRHHQRLIKDIYRVMSPNGLITFSEVDMPVVMARWILNPEDKQCSELIWGEGGDVHGAEYESYDRHVWGFSESKLRKFVEDAGFRGVERKRIHASGVWYELTLQAVR